MDSEIERALKTDGLIDITVSQRQFTERAK